MLVTLASQTSDDKKKLREKPTVRLARNKVKISNLFLFTRRILM